MPAAGKGEILVKNRTSVKVRLLSFRVPAIAALLIYSAGCEPRGGVSYVEEGPEAECEYARPAAAKATSGQNVAEIMERVRRERFRDSASAKARDAQIPAPLLQPEPKYRPGISPEAAWAVRLTREWKYIVVHHSATDTGNAAEFHKTHAARGWDGLGYDFVIGNGMGSGDGEIEVGYRWKQQLRGAHAGVAEYNEHGIGIVLVGNFNETRPTDRQMESLRRLIRFLMDYCGIEAGNVVGHNEIKVTDCPGKNFNMKALRASLGDASPALPGGSDRLERSANTGSDHRYSSRTSATYRSSGVPASKTVRVGGGAMIP